MASKSEDADVTPFGLLSSTTLSPIVYSLLQDRPDIKSKNDRLAALIEAVRTTEIEKARLKAEIQSSKQASDNIKKINEEKLAEARKCVDDLSLEKATLIFDIERLFNENAELCMYESKYNDAMNRYNETVVEHKKSIGKAKNSISKLKSQLEADHTKLELETLARVKLENTVRALREELKGKDEKHFVELNESKSLCDVSCDFAEEKLRELQDRYESSNVRIGELNRINYSLNARIHALKSSLDIARSVESKAAMNEISTGMECAAYDELLKEGEHLLKIKPSAKRSRKEFEIFSDYDVASFSLGNIEISELNPAENAIKLHNKVEMDLCLGGWQLIRKCDGIETIHTFDVSDKINGGADLTIWSTDNINDSVSMGDNSLDSQNWSFAEEIKTTLVDEDGKVVATFDRVRKQVSPRYRQMRQQVDEATDKCLLM